MNELIRGVHLTRLDLYFSTRIVFFNKNCFFRQDLSFSTRFVFFNKYCLFQHAVKKQVLSKKTRFVIQKTNLVEKDNSCRKKQFLLKKTNLVVLDERPYYIQRCTHTWCDQETGVHFPLNAPASTPCLQFCTSHPGCQHHDS